jgi:hypothetical protein
MRISKKPNDAFQLLLDILYEKYKSKICYTPKLPNNLTANHDHFTLDEEENENVVIDEQDNNDMEPERALNQENLIVQINKKRGHQKSNSDVSGIFFCWIKKYYFQSSVTYSEIWRCEQISRS